LLKNGADVNVKGEYGRTPLHLASKNGQDAVVSLLLEKEANIHAQDHDGWMPLHHACKIGHDAVVSLLLEHGADVNAKEKYSGETPLHYASWNGHEPIISVLLEKGADPTITDEKARLHCKLLKKTTTKIVLQSLRNLLDDDNKRKNNWRVKR
jgi:ankyrin repeat protein